MSIENNNEENETFAKLFEESLTGQNFSEGEIVRGKVISIFNKEAIIDIGYKSEGILNLDEFEGEGPLQVGDEIEVLFETLDEESGMVILSKRKADRQKSWDQLIHQSNEGSIIEGKIFKKVRGGFMVDIGIEAFLPASLVDLKPTKNLDQFVGVTAQFVIVKINQKRKNIVVSRKDFLEKQRDEARGKMLGTLAVGQLVKGRVKNITDFGAFIDLGGIDGLLHITDMSWGRVSHPSAVLSLGDEVEVMVIQIDKQGEKVSLGLKQIKKSPWEEIGEKYEVGMKIRGRITNILPYGAFMELQEGIEGLIHISELSWTKRVAHPSEVLTVGQEVEAAILSIDKTARKISLGLKQMIASPWENLGSKFHEGDVIKGTVRNVTDYGIFIELDPGIDGLVHISDISWLKKINHPSEIAKKGVQIEAKILLLDPSNQKISLGIKQLTEDPWPLLTQPLQTGTTCKGRITKIVNFGIFVELANGLEGLVHHSEFPKNAEAKTNFRVGDSIDVQVLNVDHEHRKIALSLQSA